MLHTRLLRCQTENSWQECHVKKQRLHGNKLQLLCDWTKVHWLIQLGVYTWQCALTRHICAVTCRCWHCTLACSLCLVFRSIECTHLRRSNRHWQCGRLYCRPLAAWGVPSSWSCDCSCEVPSENRSTLSWVCRHLGQPCTPTGCLLQHSTPGGF